MQVIRAEALGMCFGVRDAIAVAEGIRRPGDFTIHGELVHNERVTSRLAGLGFKASAEDHRKIPESPGVLITAHGVSNAERDRLTLAGKYIVDTTCPLVKRAHDAALSAERSGSHVVVAGKRGHVEVLGLTGDLQHYTIVASPEEACNLPYPDLSVICQTTLLPSVALEIVAALKQKNPDSNVRLIDTICKPTKDRQSAMAALLKKCEAVIVVGGAHSNNTRQLVRTAQIANRPVCQVSGAEELDSFWIRQFSVIGLTAGTSTPDDLISEVHARILAIGAEDPVVMEAQAHA